MERVRVSCKLPAVVGEVIARLVPKRVVSSWTSLTEGPVVRVSPAATRAMWASALLAPAPFPPSPWGETIKEAGATHLFP
jgi:hypothetical protein